MKIDTDMELWIGNIGPEKYRLVVTVSAIKNYGTKNEVVVENEDTKKHLLDKFIMQEHSKINEQFLQYAGQIGPIKKEG